MKKKATLEINTVNESGGPGMRPVILESSGMINMGHSFAKFILAMPGNYLAAFTFNAVSPCM